MGHAERRSGGSAASMWPATDTSVVSGVWRVAPTGEAVSVNVAELLWRTAARAGDHPAVVERERQTTYHGLQARAAAIAAALADAGVRPGDRVGILLDGGGGGGGGGADAIAAFFGVAAAGAIAIVVNESLRPRQIEHMLSHATAGALLTSATLVAQLPRAIEMSPPGRQLYVEDVPAAGRFTPVERAAADPVQICYTSGSTGLPKGVVITHANLWSVMDAVVAYLGITPRDRIASLLPFSFVYGFNQVLCAVGTGATLVIERSPLPQQLVATLRAQDVSVLAAVPPLWQQLLNVAAFRSRPLPSLRILTNAGGHLPPAAVRHLREAQPQAALFLMYGLTEVLRSTYLPPEEVDRRPDSIGRAIPGAEVLVLNDDLAPCGVDEVGELVHRGPTVTLGYWNDPEATARVYRGTGSARAVFSGDLVRRDGEGFLYFVGRRDRMIKTLGYRVSPDEIANVLSASGEVVECVVTAEPDAERGQRIVAFVVIAEGGELNRLKRYCAAELPRYMQPSRIEVRDALPRLVSGKHDLAALLKS
jgi:acyl-CoA synthetase (AMP-forming)/AMP-acid ligase II